MNPQPPKLYSLIKVHKDNHPIRPVVSYTTAPSIKLSKRFINIISYNTEFSPKYSIQNSSELIKKIKDVHIPNRSILLSFDVKNLFLSVPPTEVLDITKLLLMKNNCQPCVREELTTKYLQIKIV